MAAPTNLSAQQGTIVGRVTDRSAGAPISDANVSIVGTTRGTRTNAQGQYRMVGITVGAYSVRVSRLGYSAATRPITVSGDEVTADFQLAQTAVTIDEVVVSATGQSERKRENGNDVGIIKPGKDMSLAATPSLTSILAARTPGLTVTQSMGTAGSSARIRIRGANSVSLSNEPLLIVDGVRLDNSTNAFSIGVGGATISRFDDVNNEDIESIEVLKGPAASALYGTAASNGVIQITTKRGRAGRTQWRAHADYGNQVDPTDYPANFYNVGFAGTTGSTLYSGTCTNDRATQRLCRQDHIASFSPVDYYGVFQTGSTVGYGLSANGGSEVAQYYLSGDVQRIHGVSQPNKVGLVNLRANLSAQLKPNLNSTITATYVDRETGLPHNDNDIYGTFGNVLLGKAFNCAPPTPPVQCGTDTLSRGFYSAPPSTFFYQTNQQLGKRFIGGNNTTWQPIAWLTAVGQAGLDVDNLLDESLVPANVVTWINQGVTDGSRTHYRKQNVVYNANGSVTAARGLPFDVQSSTSLGAQYTNEQQHYTYATGRALVPGTGSLQTASAGKDVGENNQTVITVGGYVREQFGWHDRLFLTGSLRADENSAFGENFKLAYYPAVSASWVVSEESFFRDRRWMTNGWINQLRLRASYGQSGQKPGFRQADTYLSGVSVADRGNQELTAVIIGGTGNLELKPEISSEVEFGLDMSFFNDRLGVIYTHFSKTTRDALIARTLAPSLGVSTQQFVNLGQVYNGGNELSLHATVVDLSPLKLDMNVAGSTLKNRLKKLGQGIQPIVTGVQQHRENYPLGGFWQQQILSYKDLDGDGRLSRVNCKGQTVIATGPACEVVLSDSVQFRGSVLPTRELSVTPVLTLFKDVQLSAVVQYRGGNRVYNNTEEFRCTSSAFNNCHAVNDPKASLEDQAAAIARLMGSSWGYIERGDFTKLREASLTYTLPQRYAGRVRASSLAFTLAGRNLYTWTKYKGFDPEVNSQQNSNFAVSDFLTQPPVRTWLLRLDLGF
jgi:TonB-linked SusC/RagA family outer membrane protein